MYMDWPLCIGICVCEYVCVRVHVRAWRWGKCVGVGVYAHGRVSVCAGVVCAGLWYCVRVWVRLYV